mmetsp:Transcript_45485/g.110729  ORF Transcript_45485/g.110729 Transcript_45485/m.110729 type:complete len:573 (+) Transcript_45485:75-1793(+)
MGPSPERAGGESSSDDEVVAPSRVRPSFKKDPLSTSKASPIVTAAARRQLRGGSPDQKSAAEIAAEYRRKLNESSLSPDGKRPKSHSPAPRSRASAAASPPKAVTSPLPPLPPAPSDQPEPVAEKAPEKEPVKAPEPVKVPEPVKAKPVMQRSPEPTLLPPESVAALAATNPANRGEDAPPTADAKVSPEAGSAAPKGLPEERSRLVPVLRKTSMGMGMGAEGKVGIGIKFVPNEGGDMIVTSLLEGGPAYETHQIYPGDVIVAVNDMFVHGEPSDAVRKMIIGEPGTTVNLLLRKGSTSAAPPPSASRSIPSSETKPTMESMPTAAPAPTEPMSTMAKQAASPEQASLPISPAAETPPTAMAGGPRGGIGIKFGIDKQDRVAVIDILPGSPADECKKLKPSNRILTVNGTPVSGKSAAEIEQLIAGPPGTPVILTIRPNMDADSALVSTVHLTRKVNTPGSTQRKLGMETPQTAPPPVAAAPPVSAAPPQVMAAAKEGGAQAVVSPGGTLSHPTEPMVSEEKFNMFQRNITSRLDQLESSSQRHQTAIATQEKVIEGVQKMAEKNKCCTIS